MFSRPKDTEPKIIKEISCGKYDFGIRETRHLPNGLILFVGVHNYDTVLFLYCPIKAEKVAEVSIKGEYYFLDNACNDSFFLHPWFKNFVLQVCNSTLKWEPIGKIVETQPNNQQSLSLSQELAEDELHCTIKMPDFKNSTAKPVSLPFFTDGLTFIKLIEKDRLICTCLDDSGLLEIILFDKKESLALPWEEKDRIKLIGNNEIKSLPDKRLLTHNQQEGCFNVWNNSTLMDTFHYDIPDRVKLCKEIHPLPDKRHLILEHDTSISLYDMTTRTTKPIALNKQKIKHISICPNGTVLIITEQKLKSRLLIVDFEEIRAYRRALKDVLMKSYLYLDYLFQEEKVPHEITKAIIGILVQGHEALLVTKELEEEQALNHYPKAFSSIF